MRDTHFSIRLPWEDSTHSSDSRRLTPEGLVSPSDPSWFRAVKGAQESGGWGTRSSAHSHSTGTEALLQQGEHCSTSKMLTSPGKKMYSVGFRTIWFGLPLCPVETQTPGFTLCGTGTMTVSHGPCQRKGSRTSVSETDVDIK